MNSWKDSSLQAVRQHCGGAPALRPLIDFNKCTLCILSHVDNVISVSEDYMALESVVIYYLLITNLVYDLFWRAALIISSVAVFKQWHHVKAPRLEERCCWSPHLHWRISSVILAFKHLNKINIKKHGFSIPCGGVSKHKPAHWRSVDLKLNIELQL